MSDRDGLKFMATENRNVSAKYIVKDFENAYQIKLQISFQGNYSFICPLNFWQKML